MSTFNQRDNSYGERPRFRARQYSNQGSESFFTRNPYNGEKRPYSNFHKETDREDQRDRRERQPDQRDDRRPSMEQNRGPAGEQRPHHTLEGFKKNFSETLAPPTKYTEKEINEWRDKHSITVGRDTAEESKAGIPPPILAFSDASFPPQLSKRLTEAGFTEPTPIQAQGWSIALRGHDLIGIARTGSGKTLAFILPAFIHLRAQTAPRAGEGPIALVLAPTRELVGQIYDECVKFGAALGVRAAVAYGGASKFGQKRNLLRGCDILIATPGRLIDFLEDGTTSLERITYLVLDEADRMLDMGFEDQIREIIHGIRADRQTLMWSATWPVAVQKLAREFCNEDPIKIQVGSNDIAVNDSIIQQVEMMDDEFKKVRIFEVLRDFQKDDRIIIFCATKRGCDMLVRMLQRNNYAVNVIHGDKCQRERDQVILEFRDGHCPILVATDIAARGLDIKGVKCVINFDFPTQIEDYIHRVGRTGRAGAKGLSISFFTHGNWKVANDLVNILRDSKQDIPPELVRMGGRRHEERGRMGRFGGGGGRYARDAPEQEQDERSYFRQRSSGRGYGEESRDFGNESANFQSERLQMRPEPKMTDLTSMVLTTEAIKSKLSVRGPPTFARDERRDPPRPDDAQKDFTPYNPQANGHTTANNAPMNLGARQASGEPSEMSFGPADIKKRSPPQSSMPPQQPPKPNNYPQPANGNPSNTLYFGVTKRSPPQPYQPRLSNPIQIDSDNGEPRRSPKDQFPSRGPSMIDRPMNNNFRNEQDRQRQPRESLLTPRDMPRPQQQPMRGMTPYDPTARLSPPPSHSNAYSGGGYQTEQAKFSPRTQTPQAGGLASLLGSAKPTPATQPGSRSKEDTRGGGAGKNMNFDIFSAEKDDLFGFTKIEFTPVPTNMPYMMTQVKENLPINLPIYKYGGGF